MSTEGLLRFSAIVGKLKSVRRGGWISQVGIDEPESVADHSFRCAVVGMCIGDVMGVDTEKLIRMLLLHDIQEALTGDFDYYAKRALGMREIASQQRRAIKDVLSQLPVELARQYLRLWEEYEDEVTTEAILARDLDRIEMVMQALEYERQGYDRQKLDAFWVEVEGKIRVPLVQELFKLLVKERTTGK